MVTTTDLISALAELGSWEACRERQKWGPREMRHAGALSIWEMLDGVTEPSPWLATCPSRLDPGQEAPGVVTPRWLLGRNEGLSWGCPRGGERLPRRRGWALRLTVGRQVEDQVDHEGDEYTGHEDVDDVEEGLAAYDEVEGDVLAAGTVQRDTGVHVDLGRPVHYLPLPVL